MFRPGDWAWSLEHRQDFRIAQEDNVWEACDQVICPLDSVKPLDGRQIYQDLVPLLLLRVEGRGGNG
jgi:hypothetical protein